MKTAPLPPNEDERQRLLDRLESMGAEMGMIFDPITRALSLICEVPLARVGLTAEYHRWFRSGTGVEQQSAPPEDVFCAAIMQDEKLRIIPDLQSEKTITALCPARIEPAIRFFAGAALMLAPGVNAGALYLMDYRPRTLDARQISLLQLMAEQTSAIIKLRISRIEANHEFSTLVLVKQKLQFQKELMEAILDNEPEGVCILGVDGKLQQINKAGLDMLEAATLGQAAQQLPIDYVLPEFRDRFGRMLDQVRSGKHAIEEYRVRGLGGTMRWLESHAAPLHDEAGNIASLILITRDVTAIKQSHQHLELAARVFSDAQEGIMITDPANVIVDVNPAFCAITGYTREEIIGQTPRILHSGVQGPDFYVALWKVLSATGHWKGEIWNRKKNGELFAELISISALRNEQGKAVNYVGLFLDITEIKRQQGDVPNTPPA